MIERREAARAKLTSTLTRLARCGLCVGIDYTGFLDTAVNAFGSNAWPPDFTSARLKTLEEAIVELRRMGTYPLSCCVKANRPAGGMFGRVCVYDKSLKSLAEELSKYVEGACLECALNRQRDMWKKCFQRTLQSADSGA